MVEAMGIKGRASTDHTYYKQPPTIFPRYYCVYLLTESPFVVDAV